METHQIRYFLAVCDEGSFTRAAQLSYVSQPSLTQAIKKLEEEMGGALFCRDRAGCTLTPLGKVIEPNLRRIYQELLQTKTDAVRFTRLHKIPLRIGLLQTIGARKLSPCLARYQQAHPEVELELIVDGEASLLAQLEAKTLDLLISASTSAQLLPYVCKPLYSERYVVVFHPGHRFSQIDAVSLQQIQAEAYLDRLNCELRENLRSVCQAQAIQLYAAYRSNSEEWILHMVRAGLGVALMPEYSVPAGATDIAYRYLLAPELSRRINAMILPAGEKRAELQALLRHLQVL